MSTVCMFYASVMINQTISSHEIGERANNNHVFVDEVYSAERQSTMKFQQISFCLTLMLIIIFKNKLSEKIVQILL